MMGISKKFHKIKTRRSVISRKRLAKKKRLKKQNLNQKNKNKKKTNTTLNLPKIFSLRKNHQEVITFINKLKSCKKDDGELFLDMAHVEKIENGTIALLASVIRDLTALNIIIKGRKPLNKEARKTLEHSGFFKYMQGIKEFPDKLNRNTIYEEGNQETDPKRASEVVQQAMETITGNKSNNPAIYKLLIELMTNSVNHGFPEDKEKSTWMLSVSHHENDYVSFSFIDNGVGIMRTIKPKLLEKFKTTNFSDPYTLQRVFKGEITSSTGKNFRGKGLPSILKAYKDKNINDLYILTNKVVLDYKDKTFYGIDESFSGTFFNFKLNKSCLKV